MNRQDLHFFLGGQDAEMTTIREFLDKEGISYSDAKLAWGASTSKYGDEINNVAVSGKTPVIIELDVDSPIPENTINIDHHNERSSEKASILQVCDLLGKEPTREMLLIAANDNGYIPAMKAMGATKEEIDAIRLKDRQSQGITPEQEKQAEEAIKIAVEVYGVTVVKLSHSKSATVTDRLFDENKPQNIAIFSSDGEINYFGPEDICRKLQGEKLGKDENGYDKYDHFGGWTGGAGLGKEGGTAFWGGYPKHTEALEFILTQNKERSENNKEQDKMFQMMLQHKEWGKRQP